MKSSDCRIRVTHAGSSEAASSGVRIPGSNEPAKLHNCEILLVPKPQSTLSCPELPEPPRMRLFYLQLRFVYLQLVFAYGAGTVRTKKQIKSPEGWMRK